MDKGLDVVRGVARREAKSLGLEQGSTKSGSESETMLYSAGSLRVGHQ
jgi:hypothetical protein